MSFKEKQYFGPAGFWSACLRDMVEEPGGDAAAGGLLRQEKGPVLQPFLGNFLFIPVPLFIPLATPQGCIFFCLTPRKMWTNNRLGGKNDRIEMG